MPSEVPIGLHHFSQKITVVNSELDEAASLDLSMLFGRGSSM